MPLTGIVLWKPERLSIAVAIALLCFSRTSQAGSIALKRVTAAGVPVLVLTADLNDQRVKVTGMVAEAGKGREDMMRMVRRSHPTAAVTGTYFDVRSAVPVGDIVVNGQVAHRGGVGTGFCINAYNECEFIHPHKRYAYTDWSRFDFVCCSGPRLVTGGVATVHPGAEGFRDPGLLGRATRLAVGKTRDNRLLFVATRQPIQLGRLAKVMKSLGCIDAINLDAGGSLGFYHKGKLIMHPSRKLTNVILIYDDVERYARFKDRLAPVRHIASGR